jgi:acetolactate synthase I/II/III large subunit
VVGDGGFQMTGAELATITQEGLANVRIAIINNGFLGMVRQWQQLFHGRRYSGTPLSGPDFVALAAAYGVPGRAVTAAADLPAALDAAAAHPGPFLLDVRVAAEANVYPIVPSGAGLDGMLEREAGQ